VLIGWMQEHSGADGGYVAFRPWLVVLLLILGGVYSVAWWRRLDEAAREAHKWAWFWGANVAAFLAFGLLLLGDPGLSAARAIGFDDTLSDGITLVLGAEIIAYLIAWGFWWLRRR